MTHENIRIFNRSKLELTPDEKVEVTAMSSDAIKQETEALRASLEKVCVPMSEDIKSIVEELEEFHTNRCRRYGRETPEKPTIFLVPSEFKSSFEKPDHVGGYTNNVDSTVVVFVYPGEHDMWIAKTLAHELEHVFAFHQNRALVNLDAPEDESEISVGVYRRGGMMFTENGQYGAFLEEGAAEYGAIRYFHERLSMLYSEDYQAYLRERDSFLHEQGMKDTVKDYISPAYDKETKSMRLGGTIYAYPVGAVELLMDELPDGQELINQAHIRGNYIPIAKAFEKRFGKGTFRTFMSLPINEESIIGLTKLFAASNDKNLKAAIGDLVVTRPHDRERLRRRGVL